MIEELIALVITVIGMTILYDAGKTAARILGVSK